LHFDRSKEKIYILQLVCRKLYFAWTVMKEKQILKYFTTKAKVSIIKQPTCMERNCTKVEFKKGSSAVLLRASGGNTLTHTHTDLTLFFLH